MIDPSPLSSFRGEKVKVRRKLQDI